MITVKLSKNQDTLALYLNRIYKTNRNYSELTLQTENNSANVDLYINTIKIDNNKSISISDVDEHIYTIKAIGDFDKCENVSYNGTLKYYNDNDNDNKKIHIICSSDFIYDTGNPLIDRTYLIIIFIDIENIITAYSTTCYYAYSNDINDVFLSYDDLTRKYSDIHGGEIDMLTLFFRDGINTISEQSLYDILKDSLNTDGTLINDNTKIELTTQNGENSNDLTSYINNLIETLINEIPEKDDVNFINYKNAFILELPDISDIDDPNCIKEDIKIIIDNTLENNYTIYDKSCHPVNDVMQSFMLMRTNPKLTGNIKLVVTEDYNLYLDSFKTSTTSVLNNRQYRKQAISSDGDFAHDVYKVFRTCPQGEIYSIYPDSYNPHKNYYSQYLLIENIYEYGAEYNYDSLYSENMKILAPLYIGKKLPTYFCIFRTSRLQSEIIEDISNAQIFNDLIKSSKIIKIFDLRNHTTIGKYLNNYKDLVLDFLNGTIHLQFIEQSNDKSSENYRQGINSWRGISLDKGIFAEKNETSYFATNILNTEQSTQENYNMFLLNGFQRNNLIYPNIINLEYMFNDDTAQDFLMYNYFGLYLTENNFITINQAIKNNYDDNLSIIYYNENNEISSEIDKDSMIALVLATEDFSNRIFFTSCNNNVTHVKNIDNVQLFIKDNALNKPDKNLAHTTGEQVTLKLDEKSYISLKFTKQINPGEHFRFIHDNKIIDIIASNDSRLLSTKYNINPYVLTNYVNNNELEYLIYAITFYVYDENNLLASLKTQLYRLANAIYAVDKYVNVSNYDEDTMCIIGSHHDIKFQHILDRFTNNDEHDKYDSIRYYNYNNIAETKETTANDLILYGLELAEQTSQRTSVSVDFIDLQLFKDQYLYQIDTDLFDVLNSVPYPIVYTKYGYYPLNKFNIAENDNITDRCCCIISPFDVNKNIICSLYELLLLNNNINFYSPMKSHVSIMGINNIKDIDMNINVLNQEQRKTDIFGYFNAGEKVLLFNKDTRLRNFVLYELALGSIPGIILNIGDKFMLFNQTIYVENNTDAINLPNGYLDFTELTIIKKVNYYDMDIYDYTTNVPVLSEKNYYIDQYNTETSNLNIPLVPLVNCQWKSNGQYFDFNSYLDTDKLSNYDLTGNFVETVYTPAAFHNSMYNIAKFSNLIIVNDKQISIKDYILNGGSIKKILTQYTKLNPAISYYNAYLHIIEFIYYGIKFSFKLSNVKFQNTINLLQFNNYSTYVIIDPSTEKNDIIISQLEEIILLIIHEYTINLISYNSNAIKQINGNTIEDIDYDIKKYPYTISLYNSINLDNTTNNLYIKRIDETIQDNIYKFILYDIATNMTYNNLSLYAYIDAIKHDNDIFDILPNVLIYDSLTKNMKPASNELLTAFYGNTYDFRDLNTYALYVSNNDFELDELPTYKDKLQNFIASFDDTYNLYIVSNNNATLYQINSDYSPINLNMSLTDKIKYHYGYFDVAFIDMFDFYINDNISEALNIDTLLANTCISNISNFTNYVFNKIMNHNTLCVYNYFIVDSLSPFYTDWDYTIYRQYNDDQTYEYIPGLYAGLLEKTFFGAKSINIHNDYISINDFENKDYVYDNIIIDKQNEHTSLTQSYQLTINITQAFYDYFITNETLQANYKIANANNENITKYITNFVKNTLLKIYNLNINNIEVQIYKQYIEDDNTILTRYKNFNNEITDELCENAKIGFSEINNEIILTISLYDYTNYIFKPIIKIKKQ